jgi:hypothetical protein
MYKACGKTKNKKGGSRPEGNITDPKNTRMEVTRRHKIMKASSNGVQRPEVAIRPQTDRYEYMILLSSKSKTTT